MFCKQRTSARTQLYVFICGIRLRGVSACNVPSTYRGHGGLAEEPCAPLIAGRYDLWIGTVTGRWRPCSGSGAFACPRGRSNAGQGHRCTCEPASSLAEGVRLCAADRERTAPVMARQKEHFGRTAPTKLGTSYNMPQNGLPSVTSRAKEEAPTVKPAADASLRRTRALYPYQLHRPTAPGTFPAAPQLPVAHPVDATFAASKTMPADIRRECRSAATRLFAHAPDSCLAQQYLGSARRRVGGCVGGCCGEA